MAADFDWTRIKSSIDSLHRLSFHLSLSPYLGLSIP
jgi:hypothetical protein